MRAALGLLALVVAGCSAGRAPPPAAPVARAPVAAPRPAPAPERPRWRPRRVVPDAVEVRPSEVMVQRGDSLAAIAQRSGASVGAIAVANGIAPPYVIRPGQRLRVPGGRYHSVKPGEMGITIARAYGAEWKRVAAANGLEPPYTLEIGDRLLIPTRSQVAAMSLEERARAYSIDIDDLITGAEPAVGTAAARPRPAPARTAPPRAQVVAIQLIWPVEGRIVSRFGPKPGGRYNDGINIAAAAGTPVRAAADGVVAYADDGIAAFGGLVLLKHEGGWVTAYGHNEALLVARGERVARGQAIARVGATGAVDAPQLHFEVRRGRTPVDPAALLPAAGAG